MQRTDLQGVLGFCRAGFEAELAAELTEYGAQAGISGYARAERGAGHALFLLTESDSPGLERKHSAPPLIFSRQSLELMAELTELDTRDRISPILAGVANRAGRFGDLVVTHPDSDTGKPLSGLARALGNALRPALVKAGILSKTTDAARPTLHVVLLGGAHILLAQSPPSDTPSWPGGIPRLRLLREAPSRSALKLEEAILVLLSARERDAWLKPGMRAADLGAAPGGWSWVLARHHLRVTALDNGPLAESAHATGLIDHVRADGFTWHPPRPLDWVVCDMVEQPRRVAELMANWLVQGWSRRALFNLKLPMKKRWAETRLCLDLMTDRCGPQLRWRGRQLYHDREEITLFADLGG